MKPQRLSGTHSEGLCIYIKMMKEIKLTQGFVALVDDEDFERVNAIKWHVYKSKHTSYAIGAIYPNGKQKSIWIHQVIMNPYDRNIIIDHKDHNGLNCQKYNLRKCTRSQNCQNKKLISNCKSEYKGVTKSKYRFRSRITKDKILVHIGYFKTEIEAAKAYDIKAKELFGEFALINFD